MKNQRIKNLSTRYLSFYKNSVLVVLLGLLFYFVANAAYATFYDDLFTSNTLLVFFYFGFMVYGWIRINRNVHRVEFDDDYLYVILPKQDLLIPLENIKEIDIKSMGGVYEVELYSAEQLGKKFYFKPSLLYPFNYKSKDALVNLLRRNINIAQARKQQYRSHTLMS